MSAVVTWQSPNGGTVNITPTQEARLQAAGKWPKDRWGREFCEVSHGLHDGAPTFTDAELETEVGL